MPHAKTHFVCLPCRGSYKQSYPAPQGGQVRVCPRCGEALIHVGSAFAAPKSGDDEGWRVLALLLRAGIRFHKSCCGGPGYRPRTLREVRERLAFARRTGEPVAEVLVRPDLL